MIQIIKKKNFPVFVSPSTLFGKILLWFTVYIVAFYLLTIGVYFAYELGIKSIFWTEVAGDALILYGQTTVEKYETGGKDAVEKLFKRVEEKGEMQLVLFNDQGLILSGKEPSQTIADLVRQAVDKKADFLVANSYTIRHKPILARRITGPSGKDYFVVTEASGNFLETIFSSYTVVQLVVFFTLAALFSFFIARYLTEPIRKLHSATKRLGHGDLSVRVGYQNKFRQDELIDLAREFDKMAAKIEILEEIRQQLFSDVSHELRSPLTRLNIALEMARQQNRPEVARFIDRIELESGRLNNLIERLLTAAREKNNEESEEASPIDLGELLKECLSDANFEAQNRNCRVELTSTVNLQILAKRDLIKSAVGNVMLNAIRYTKNNTAVEVSLLRTQKEDIPMAQIRIRDHGKGVPENLLSIIFQPFFRVDDSRDRQSGGSGLGLAITERIVNFYRGSIVASNAIDSGLIVDIFLPVYYERQNNIWF